VLIRKGRVGSFLKSSHNLISMGNELSKKKKADFCDRHNVEVDEYSKHTATDVRSKGQKTLRLM
jgi:hypothetical protein